MPKDGSERAASRANHSPDLHTIKDLQSDRQQREQERREIRAAVERAIAPVLDELARAGFQVEDIYDLPNSGHSYHAAIPILLKWLPQVEYPVAKESIVRALSVRAAKSTAAPQLVAEFRQAPPETELGLKWAIGNALSVVADDSVFDDVVDLVQDKRHGRGREMLALALANMKNPCTVDILIALLDDEQVAGHAVIALGRLKAKRARTHLERFLTHSKSWVRTEAKRALAKIDKAK
jgi:hypothetical protein